MAKNIAIVRLRGTTGISGDVADTLSLLNLRQINHCIVVEESPVISGMLRKAKDYITWGMVSDETLKLLIEKRGALPKGKVEKKKMQLFRLCPARGGLGRRGIKAAFSKSGALGDRREKINDLIRKML